MAENLEILADFLADTLKVEKDEDPKKTIEAAVEKLKANKQLDKQDVQDIKDDIEPIIEEDVQPICEEEIYGADNVPNFVDYAKKAMVDDQQCRMEVIKKRYNGIASVKDWAELDLCANPKLALARDTDEEFDFVQVDDCDFDDENDIAYKDIDNFLADLSVGEYIDLYEPDEFDDVEFVDIDDEDEEDELENEYNVMQDRIRQAVDAAELTEALTQAERIKRSLIMKRNKAKIALKRRMAMKKHATPEQLEKRARKLAIKMLKKRFAKKDPSEMGYAEKQRIEKIIDAKQPLVDRLERKMLPVVRQIERDRFKPAAAK
jgi:hypothetical protein